MNAAPPTATRSVGRRVQRAFVILVVLALGALAVWTWLAISFSYSEGVRAGVVQKFSRKGWICKTDEGELAQFIVAGVSPQIWEFSVREESVAADLSKTVGKPVRLHYREHRGIPTSCFGDTRYFVDRVELAASVPSVEVQPGSPATPAAPAAAPALTAAPAASSPASAPPASTAAP